MRNYEISWREAEDRFDELPFPSYAGDRTSAGGTHRAEGKEHQTLTYYYDESKHNFRVGGYAYEFKYTYCEECKKAIKKYGAIFNDNTNTCFYKEY